MIKFIKFFFKEKIFDFDLDICFYNFCMYVVLCFIIFDMG